jgi:hypothetical protein
MSMDLLWIMPVFLLLGWMQPGVRCFSEPNPLDDPVDCAIGLFQGVVGCFAILLGLIALLIVAVVVLLGVLAFK